jgi:hypothetical protein
VALGERADAVARAAGQDLEPVRLGRRLLARGGAQLLSLLEHVDVGGDHFDT